MDAFELRDYCLSLSPEVEERFPFAKFRAAVDVLVFYICGHMFCYFDISHPDLVTVKCQPERIAELKAQYPCITAPYNMSPRYWIGILIAEADAQLLRELIRNSFEIVSHQSTNHKS